MLSTKTETLPQVFSKLAINVPINTQLSRFEYSFGMLHFFILNLYMLQ